MKRRRSVLAMLVMSVLLEHNCVMVTTEDLDPGLPGVAIPKAGSHFDWTLEGDTVPTDVRVGMGRHAG